MPRLRHKRKVSAQAEAEEIHQKLPVSAAEVTSAARRVVEKIAQGGADYINEHLFDAMTTSEVLADEPEFADWSFDAHQYMQVHQRIEARYQRKLDAVPEEQHSDWLMQIRLDALEEMMKPLMRRDFRRRLDQLVRRLMTASEPDKLETALLIQAGSQIKDFPWALCGLVDAVLRRSIQREIDDYNRQFAIFGSLLDELGPDADAEDILTLLDDPERQKALFQNLPDDPEMIERLSEQADSLEKEFYRAIRTGKIELPVFTPGELEILVGRFLQYIQENPLTQEDGVEAAGKLVSLGEESLKEILTPERWQALLDDLRAIAERWRKERHPFAGVLILRLREIDDLDALEAPQDGFVSRLYIFQMRQLLMLEVEPSEKPRRKKKRR